MFPFQLLPRLLQHGSGLHLTETWSPDQCKFPLAQPQPARACACVCACRTDLRGQTFCCCRSLTPTMVPALVPECQCSLDRSMLRKTRSCGRSRGWFGLRGLGRQPGPVRSHLCASTDALPAAPELRDKPAELQRETGRGYYQSDAPKLADETSSGPPPPLRSSLASSTAVREDGEMLVRPSLDITVEQEDRLRNSRDATSALQNQGPVNVGVVPPGFPPDPR